jgi:rhodanese-related sulfurtransferase
VQGRGRGGRGRVQVTRAKKEDDDASEEFVRSETQQKIKNADDAVKNAQKAFGMAFENFGKSSGLSKALGIGGKSKSKDGRAKAGGKEVESGSGLDLPSGSGKGTKDLSRSGQSKKWMDARQVLLQGGIVSVGTEEAQSLLRGGKTVLLDVRPSAEYAAFHPKGSSNAQFYRYPNSSDLFTLGSVRQLAYAAQGVQPVEKNKDFLQDAREAIEEKKATTTVIVACGSGGTMTETDNFPIGQASRSLLAAAELMPFLKDGGKGSVRIMHLRGGLNAWFRDGGEGEGEKDAWDDTSSKVPFVAGFSVEQDADELS